MSIWFTIFGIKCLVVNGLTVTIQLWNVIYLRDFPWFLNQCFVLSKDFKSFAIQNQMKRKSEEVDILALCIASFALPGIPISVGLILLSVLNPEFPLLLSSVISLPGYANYLAILLSSLSFAFLLFAICGGPVIIGLTVITYGILVDQILSHLTNNSSNLSYKHFLTIYRKLKILEINMNSMFSPLAFLVQIYFMQEIVLSCFVAIRFSEASFVVLGTILGLNAAQIIATAIKLSAGIYSKSAQLLSIRTKSQRLSPIGRRIQRSLRPLYTWVGGMYYADSGLTLTVLDLTLGQTIDLLLAN
ncbi:unnamed protein product [Allacma fusca]|uniref:Uncharacterized protein n=1 Tax=Allacma fusca TaxID=39272 RepID=A0A8J2NNU1_9HEXA|nr:unnamed protein product [Allacma fusca]